jgi:RNA polymerase sigma-70 factor (ECF subfamily)
LRIEEETMNATITTQMFPRGAAARPPLPAAPGQPADDELVARVRAGDHDAFAALVERHKRLVHSLAYRILGNAADAEDAAQETFVRAYTRLATYQPDGRFGAWLGAICSHWCIDTLRARGRRVQTVALGKVPESDRFISQLEEPEAHALQRDAHDEAQRWLAALPPKYRAVLVLRYLNDLSYSEIAAALGEPVSTVRMRLFRARAMLQQVVSQERASQPGPARLANARPNASAA